LNRHFTALFGLAPHAVIYAVVWCVVSFPATTAFSDQKSLGLVVKPESRCAPFRSHEYPFPKSLELKIVAKLGGIYSPYTDQYYNSTRQTDIDHVVALSEAHDSGLCATDAATKRAFASDLLNVTLAPPKLNRGEKKGLDAADWLPGKNRCWFARRVVDVRTKYGLTVDRQEADALQAVLSQCKTTDLEISSREASIVDQAPRLTSTPPQKLSQLIDTKGNGLQGYINHGILTVAGLLIGLVIVAVGLCRGSVATRAVIFDMKVPGGIEVRTNAEGLALVVVGVFLIIMSFQFFARQKSFAADSAELRPVVSRSAHAQTGFPKVLLAEVQEHASAKTGWAYLGPAHDEDQWNFRLQRVDPKEGIILRATKPTTLWKERFGAFSATLLGPLLGDKKPEKVGVAEKDSCFKLVDDQDIERVALVELWLKVEEAVCPK